MPLKKRGKSLNILKNVEPSRVLNLLDLDQISRYFQGFEHEVGLQLIDAQMLEIVYQKIKEKPVTTHISQTDKIDVLTLGKKQLLSFCQNKHLVPIYGCHHTIQNSTYMKDSYYGNLLVNKFPEQFFIGPKSTHYHCKTTAKKIEKEYGINQPSSDDQEQRQNNLSNQSDEDFINDEEEDYLSNEQEEQQQEQSEPTMKRKSKRQCRQQKLIKKQEKKPNLFSFIKKKNMVFLDSDGQNKNNEQAEQSEQITMQRRKTQPKSEKKQLAFHSNQKQCSEESILKIIQDNEIQHILEMFSYKQIFQYLLQFCEDKLLSILDDDDLLTAINANKLKAKRQKRKAKKVGAPRLKKTKINIKTLTLQELLDECVKEQIIEETDTLKSDLINSKNHVIYGHKLIAKNPSKYSKEGTFNGYALDHLNNEIEKHYLNYQPSQSSMEENLNQSAREGQFESNYQQDEFEKGLNDINEFEQRFSQN